MSGCELQGIGDRCHRNCIRNERQKTLKSFRRARGVQRRTYPDVFERSAKSPGQVLDDPGDPVRGLRDVPRAVPRVLQLGRVGDPLHLGERRRERIEHSGEFM